MKMKKILQKLFPKLYKARAEIYVNIKRANTKREKKTLKESRKLSYFISLASRALKKGYNTDDDDDEARRFLGVSSVLFRIRRSTTTTTKRIGDVNERFVVVVDDDGRRRRRRRERRRRERKKARFHRRGWCDDDYRYE